MVIQPSELLKIATPLMLAWWFQRREGNLRASDFAIAFVLLMVPVGLIMKQPDLGTSLLVMAAGLSVIFFAGLPWKLIVPPVVLGVVGIFLVIWYEPQLCADGVSWYFLHDYQRTRVCTLLDPTRDPLGKGFHIIQGMIAIGSGASGARVHGRHANSPGIHSRAHHRLHLCRLFRGIWPGGQSFHHRLLSVSGLAWSAIAMSANSLFGRLMAAAVSMIFFTYAFVNMGMVSGILPVVGVPLPFISYGGTAMVTLGLSLGVLMSVARAQRQLPGGMGTYPMGEDP